MKPLQAMVLMVLMAGCARAELTAIGIKVTRTANGKPVVSVFEERKSHRDLTVSEAAALLQAEKGAGSVVLVGIVVEGAHLSDYIRLLDAIAQNSMLELTFIECDGPDTLNDNIRRRIDPDGLPPKKKAVSR